MEHLEAMEMLMANNFKREDINWTKNNKFYYILNLIEKKIRKVEGYDVKIAQVKYEIIIYKNLKYVNSLQKYHTIIWQGESHLPENINIIEDNPLIEEEGKFRIRMIDVITNLLKEEK